MTDVSNAGRVRPAVNEPNTVTFEGGTTTEISPAEIALIRALMERRFWSVKDAYRFQIACRDARGARTRGELLRLQDEMPWAEKEALVLSVPRVASMACEVGVGGMGGADVYAPLWSIPQFQNQNLISCRIFQQITLGIQLPKTLPI